MTSPLRILDQEVLLDIAVNIVPMAIIAIFGGLFLFVNYWSQGPLLGRLLEFAILVLPFGGLAFLTVVAAWRMEILDDGVVGPYGK